MGDDVLLDAGTELVVDAALAAAQARRPTATRSEARSWVLGPELSDEQRFAQAEASRRHRLRIRGATLQYAIRSGVFDPPPWISWRPPS